MLSHISLGISCCHTESDLLAISAQTSKHQSLLTAVLNHLNREVGLSNLLISQAMADDSGAAGAPAEIDQQNEKKPALPTYVTE